MKSLIPFAVLFLAGCAGSLQADYVKADRATHDAFGPMVARDVAAGHQDSQFLFDSWTARLLKAEKATSQPSQ